jgi:hypothetical protein
MLSFKANCYSCVMCKGGDAAPPMRRPNRSDLMALFETIPERAIRSICQSDCHSTCNNT